jgi:hypothetical protein
MKKGLLAGKGIYVFGIIIVIVAGIMINYFWDTFFLGNYAIGSLDARMGCIPMLSSIAGCGAKALFNIILILSSVGLVIFALWG